MARALREELSAAGRHRQANDLRSYRMSLTYDRRLLNDGESCLCRLGVLTKEDHNLDGVAACSPKILVVMATN